MGPVSAMIAPLLAADEAACQQSPARTPRDGAMVEKGDMSKRRCEWLAFGVLCVALFAAPTATRAQDFPSKPIKIIVPNPPGGAGDITARLVGQKLSDAFH